LDERCKLKPWPLHKSPKPKSGKSRLNLHGTTILEGKSIGSDTRKQAKWRAHDMKNQDVS